MNYGYQHDWQLMIYLYPALNYGYSEINHEWMHVCWCCHWNLAMNYGYLTMNCGYFAMTSRYLALIWGNLCFKCILGTFERSDKKQQDKIANYSKVHWKELHFNFLCIHFSTGRFIICFLCFHSTNMSQVVFFAQRDPTVCPHSHTEWTTTTI